MVFFKDPKYVLYWIIVPKHCSPLFDAVWQANLIRGSPYPSRYGVDIVKNYNKMKKWNFLLGLILEKQELIHNNFKTCNNTHKQWKGKCAKKRTLMTKHIN